MTDEQLGGQSIGEGQIQFLVVESALAGADRLAIGAELEALSSGWAEEFPDLGVRAQSAAVSVLTFDAPGDYAHAYAAAGATHTLIARLEGAGRRAEALARAADAVSRWISAGSFAQTEAEIEAVANELTLLQKLVLHLGDSTDAIAAQKAAVSVLASFDPPADQQPAHDALQANMVVTLEARLRELLLPETEVQRQVREIVERPGVQKELDAFYRDQVGLLVVGAPTGAPTLDEDGAWRQQFRFGSLIKPQDVPVRFETRWAVSIGIAAIKCFGTDDPSDHDEPYVIASVSAVDPLIGTNAISVKRHDWETASHGKVFATEGWQVANGFFIPGEGYVSMTVSFWDREAASPSGVVDKWHAIVTTGLLAGLAQLHPLAAAGGAVVDFANHLVEDLADDLINFVLGPFEDDLIDTVGFKIDADFLSKLQDDPSR